MPEQYTQTVKNKDEGESYAAVESKKDRFERIAKRLPNPLKRDRSSKEAPPIHDDGLLVGDGGSGGVRGYS